MKESLTPRALASAIGVSESSVKRWVDEGAIEAVRTAGGHRRIPMRAVVRFLREKRVPLAHPELLGFDDLAAARHRGSTDREDAEDLFRSLMAGSAPEARGLILSLYLSGRSIASIIDGPLRSAMERIGEFWMHGQDGICVEHRATDICIQALDQIRLLLPVNREAAGAIGGAPAGDPYLLPSIGVEAVLASEGYHARNLGPDTPIDALEAAAVSSRPRVIWLSVSSAERPRILSSQIASLLTRLPATGATLAIGGAGMCKLSLEPHASLFVGSTMAELAAFARGLLARPAPR